MNEDVRAYWDRQAATFDEDPDHGLRDPLVREAWTSLLLPLLPPAPASVVDLGCGTGSLSVLLAGATSRTSATCSSAAADPVQPSLQGGGALVSAEEPVGQ